MRWVLTTSAGQVDVSLDADTHERVVPLRFHGRPDAIAQVQRDVEMSSGLYGHLIGTHACPVDLALAMTQPVLAPFQPKLVEGEALLDQPVEALPDGAVS